MIGKIFGPIIMPTEYIRPAKGPRILSSILSLADFERIAQKRLPKPLFGYVSGACEDGQSLQANRSVFAEYELSTRILVDISQRRQDITLFGQQYASPIGIAPMGITAMTSYRGDVVLAERPTVGVRLATLTAIAADWLGALFVSPKYWAETE